MMNITILIPALIGVVVMCVVFLIFYLTRSAIAHRTLIERMNQREQAFTAQGNVGTLGGLEQTPTGFKQFFARIASVFGDFAKPKSEEDFSRVQKNLASIGYKNPNAAMIFLGVKVLFSLLLPAGFFVFKYLGPIPLLIPPFFTMGIYILLAAMGFYFPGLWLHAKIAKRKERILEGFPDALDMMVVCVEAGMGLDAAIDRVAEEMKLSNEVISEELRQYNRELRIGRTRRNALKNLAQRSGLEDVASLVTLLIQTDKFGTSIAQALRTHSDYMRTQRFQRAEEKAAKLALKLLFPLIFCIFPSLFVVLLGPAFIHIFRMFLVF